MEASRTLPLGRCRSRGAGCRLSADTAKAAARDDGTVCDPADVAGGRQEEPQRKCKTCGKRLPVSGSLQTRTDMADWTT